MSHRAAEAYEQRLKAARSALETLDSQAARLANLRALTFIGAAILTGLVVFERISRVGLLGAGALIVSFIVLIVVHGRVLHEETKAKVRVALNERGLARLNGQWRTFTSTGLTFLKEGHLYGADLDVVGQGSLFQRLDETGTRDGERKLASWLLEPMATPADIVGRQGAVTELAPLVDFRQALITEARIAGQAKANPEKFIAWAEAPSRLGKLRWAFLLAHGLAPVTLLLGVLGAFDVVSPLAFLAGLALHLVVIAITRKKLGAVYAALMMGEQGFVRFEETFRAIDGQTFTHPLLDTLKRGIDAGGPSVAVRLAEFARLLNLAALRQSAQLHPFINALTLWDVLVLFRVEAWRVAHGGGVRGWFDALAQFEALSSFAGFTFERDDCTFPTVDDGAIHFDAAQLRHPLLEKAIANDVTLPQPGAALIITGSNMSGKTTLMRAMGLNAVMALAGLPVAAKSLSLSRVQVLTSMRVKDSLERGTSYFYAEVTRMKTLLDAAAKHPQRCLFFLDELFMGTNTKERQIASKHLMRVLLDAGAAGCITTHDLSLCEIADERPELVRNVHFRDEIVGGDMSFDYQLRTGIVQTTNALEVLRRAGVPMPS